MMKYPTTGRMLALAVCRLSRLVSACLACRAAGRHCAVHLWRTCAAGPG